MSWAKYVAWRNGKPRFMPSPQLREEGYKGKDLRHADGRWFSQEETVQWSEDFMRKRPLWPGLRVMKKRPETRVAKARRGQGFIYFLWCGDLLKVGFSKKPHIRVASLLTANGEPMRLFLAVPGEAADEGRIHKRLAFHRTRGEWFNATPAALDVIAMELEAAVKAVPMPKGENSERNAQ